MLISAFIAGMLSMLGIEFIVVLTIAIGRSINGKEKRRENSSDENK